jgi:hypothetical protein
MIRRRAGEGARWWRITLRPKRLSASFHGRDLFAPVAARLACDETPLGQECPSSEMLTTDWPDDLAEVVYVDVFGNVITGIRASTLTAECSLVVSKRRLCRARTFSDVSPGEAFWYENSNGLAEVAVNMGRADAVLGVATGSPVAIRADRTPGATRHEIG